MAKEALGLPYQRLVETGYIPETFEGNYTYYRFGTRPDDLADFFMLVNGEGEFRERTLEMEHDESFAQISMYGYDVRPDGTFFIMQRGGESYSEARLQNKTAVGLGGHMERFDADLERSLVREVGEEAAGLKDGEIVLFQRPDKTVDFEKIGEAFSIQVNGLLRDRTTSVDRAHVALVCRLVSTDPDMKLDVLEHAGNLTSEYVTPEQFEAMRESGQIDPESWALAVYTEEILPEIQRMRAAV